MVLKAGYVSTGDVYRPSDSIAGALLDIRGKNPAPFIVIDNTGYWALRLKPYCKVTETRRKGYEYIMRFSFRELFTCLYRFPNFASALLAIEKRPYDVNARILLEYPFLARYTTDINFEDIKTPVFAGRSE